MSQINNKNEACGQHDDGYCSKCKKHFDFLKLAYWTDSTYKCPVCFKTVEISRYPSELIVLGEIPNSNKPIIIIVLDGLYIAGVQRHCLFLLDSFHDLGFDTILISLEGGGLWLDIFVKKSSCLIVSNPKLRLTWSSIARLLSSDQINNIRLFSTHLISPTLWAVDNIPYKFKIYSSLHSEPSEHENFTPEILDKIINRCNNIIFPSLGTLETFVNYSIKFSQNKNKLLILDNLLYNTEVEIRIKNSQDYVNIAVVSRIDSDKFSIPLFIDTIKILTEKISNLQIKVAGNGELYDKLETAIKEEQLCHYISLEGFVMDTSDIYNWATIVFLPSKRESMPYVMLESLAYNIPIVLPNIGYTIHAKKNKLIYPFAVGIANDAAENIIKAANEHIGDYMDYILFEKQTWKEKVEYCYLRD